MDIDILDAINKQTEEQANKEPVREEKIENEEQLKESFKITEEKIEATHEMLELEIGDDDEEDEFLSRAKKSKERRRKKEEEEKKNSSSSSSYSYGYGYGYNKKKELTEEEKKKKAKEKEKKLHRKLIKARIAKVIRAEKGKPFDIFEAHRIYENKKKASEYIKGIDHVSVNKEIARTKSKLRMGIAVFKALSKVLIKNLDKEGRVKNERDDKKRS